MHIVLVYRVPVGWFQLLTAVMNHQCSMSSESISPDKVNYLAFLH